MLAYFALTFLFSPAPTADESKIIATEVKNLSHARFAIRERASRALLKIGSPAKVSLRRAMLTNEDTEVVDRAKAIFWRIAEKEVESLYPLPYIDSLWYDKERKTYNSKMSGYVFRSYLDIVGRDGPPWHKYREATVLLTRKWIADGLNPAFVRIIFAELHARDAVFISTCHISANEKDPPIAVDPKEYLRKK